MTATAQGALARLKWPTLVAALAVFILAAMSFVAFLRAKPVEASAWEWLTSLTLPTSILVSDALVFRVAGMRSAKGKQVVLGLAVPGNTLLLAVAAFVLFAPGWYGIPAILILIGQNAAAAIVLLVGFFARVIVVVRTFSAHRMLSKECPSRGWATGLALSPLLSVGGLSPALGEQYLFAHPDPAPAAEAIRAALMTASCAERFATTHGGRLPDRLVELGPAGSACLEGSLAQGRLGGWAVRWDAAQHIVVARERMRPFATYRSYLVDATGTLHTAGYARREARVTDPQVEGIANQLQELGRCMSRLAELEPNELPASLWSMSRCRSGCYVLPGARWRAYGDSNVAELRMGSVDRGSAYEENYRFSYRPYRNITDGVDSADIEARPVTYGETGLTSYLLTSHGEIHATAAERGALRSDPPAMPCKAHLKCANSEIAILPYVGQGPDSVDKPTLRPAWQARLAPRLAGGSYWQPPAPLVTTANIIVAAGQMGVYGYTADGTRRWARPDIGVIQGSPVEMANHDILVVDSVGVARALDDQGGDVWRTAVGQTHTTAAVSRTTVYVAADRVINAISPAGRLLWSHPAGGVVDKIAAASDGGVYARVEDRFLHFSEEGRLDAWAPADSLGRCPQSASPTLNACYKLFRATLDPTGPWRFARFGPEMSPRASNQLVRRTQVTDDGTVLLLGDGAVRAVRADLSTAWRLPEDLRRGFQARAPAVLRNGDVVAVWTHGLIAIDRSGEPKWISDLGDSIFSDVAVGPDGVVYVLDTQWRLTAVWPLVQTWTKSTSPDALPSGGT